MDRGTEGQQNIFLHSPVHLLCAPPGPAASRLRGPAPLGEQWAGQNQSAEERHRSWHPSIEAGTSHSPAQGGSPRAEPGGNLAHKEGQAAPPHLIPHKARGPQSTPVTCMGPNLHSTSPPQGCCLPGRTHHSHQSSGTEGVARQVCTQPC